MDSLSYCFKWSVLNSGQLEFTFIFQKVSSPASSENEMSLNPSHHYQISFPGWLEYGISNVIPQFIGIRSIKFHSPVGRITEVYSNSVFSSVVPRLSDDGMSKVSSPVCLVQRCHRSKCLFLQTISLRIHFKISQCLFKILFSFHLSSYNYQHGSGQSFSPVNLQYLLAESDPSLQTNLGIPFLSKQIIFVILHS